MRTPSLILHSFRFTSTKPLRQKQNWLCDKPCEPGDLFDRTQTQTGEMCNSVTCMPLNISDA